MRAPVLFEHGRPQVLEEVEVDDPKEGEVLIRMAASGVCHSCLHAAEGAWGNLALPMILGDEGSGVIEAVGPGVTTLSPGDHVILAWAPACGHCSYCVQGRPILCVGRPTIAPRMRVRGQSVTQYGGIGTHGPYSVALASVAIPIRKDMPLDKAALIGCSIMTGVGAVLNTAQVPAGATMAVWGVGGVGLNMVQGGNLAGASQIIAVDITASKLEDARKLGATHLVNAAEEDPVDGVRRITGHGAEYTFVAVGNTAAVTQAVDALAKGGTCVVAGVPAAGAMTQVGAHRLAVEELCIKGSLYGSTRAIVDFPRLVDLYMAGRLKIDELISRRFSVDEVNEAFRALAAGELARGLIVFPGVA